MVPYLFEVQYVLQKNYLLFTDLKRRDEKDFFLDKCRLFHDFDS